MARPDLAATKHLMADPGRWPRWPVLPVVNVEKGPSAPVCGWVHCSSMREGATIKVYAQNIHAQNIHAQNIHDLKRGGDELPNHVEFVDVEGMYDAGWRID
jgi:hypothetical protein